MASNKYCEYFDVNESYFPCIDESAINAGAPWETTYPHETSFLFFYVRLAAHVSNG